MSLQWKLLKFFNEEIHKPLHRKNIHKLKTFLANYQTSSPVERLLHSAGKTAQKLPSALAAMAVLYFSMRQITVDWQLAGLLNIFRPRARYFQKEEVLEIENGNSASGIPVVSGQMHRGCSCSGGAEGHNGVCASPPLAECTMMKGWGGEEGTAWKMSPVTIHVSPVHGSDPHNLVVLPKLPISMTPGMTCHRQWNRLRVLDFELENRNQGHYLWAA